MCKFYTVDFLAIPDHHLEFLCLQTCNLCIGGMVYGSLSKSRAKTKMRYQQVCRIHIGPVLIPCFFFAWGLDHALNKNDELTETTRVSVIVRTLTFEMAVGVDTGCRWMATVCAMETFVDVMTISAVCLVARLAFAVVPTGHIYTIRRRFTCVQTSCTFV